MASIRISGTPNPNSLKFSRAGGFADGNMIVARSVEEAASHPLAHKLFALEGIVDILLLADFATITKSADSTWDSLLPQIEATLQAA